MPKTASTQLQFAFVSRGGARQGSGRKRIAPRPSVPHRARAKMAKRFPVHVTLRVVPGVPSLRGRLPFRVLLEALLACAERERFWLVEYSVQSNHVHLICEATSRTALARGIQGLKVCAAKRLNRLWKREGGLFDGRYHDHVLRSPREVRNALIYLFENSVKHGIRHSSGIDPCSSARWFHGERGSPLPCAKTWLLRVGWKRCGSIEVK